MNIPIEDVAVHLASDIQAQILHGNFHYQKTLEIIRAGLLELDARLKRLEEPCE